MPDDDSLSPAEMERLANEYDLERQKQEGRRVRTDMRHGKEGGVSGYLDKKFASLFARQTKGKLRRQHR
jgi:hypothetical protein